MEPRNTETSSQQYEDGSESLFKSLTLPRLRSCSSTDDSCLYSCNCEENCTECDYNRIDNMFKTWRIKKARGIETKLRKQIKSFSTVPPREGDAKIYKTNEASNDTLAKLKSELSKNYCPYSSDNCGCSSGCTDCDYGLHTYTTKNKTKLKSKVKEPHVKSSNGFRQLKMSERSRKPAKSFSTVKVLRKKTREELPNKKVLESCYPESSSSYDCKSDYAKRDSKEYTTTNRVLKVKKKILSRKLKTATVTTRKLLGNKKALKNTATKVSEKNFLKNWFPDSNSCDSSCTDYKKYENTKRRKMKNRSQRMRASTNLNTLNCLQ
ncbi:uncharacterized protein LOC105194357 [Solenopsis invicta]|uniref:uncharacterized protein LOC105194357 n=1 Tax=Solenopsis invicta TaxID=13686 RepID=UPI00193D2D67|nr:uncharacterized protein LOC105194357 [Solenopsis invicta]